MKVFCYPNTTIVTSFIEVSDQVRLRLTSFTPPECNTAASIVFLPGLGSIIENFRDTLIALTKDYKVFFLETREKGSSEIKGRVGFSIGEIASDLPVVIERMGLQSGEYLICSYSLGAAVTMSALKHIANKPLAVVLVEPSGSFRWPWWLPTLARVAVPFYGVIKPFLKWYMKKFYINTEGDYEMYEINARILDRANPRKLAATVVAIAKYNIRNDLVAVNTPALVIGVSKDKFHSHDEASEIASAIEGCCYVDVETNKRSHSSEVADIIQTFLERDERLAAKAGCYQLEE
jgi:pimeloyl-ACP methyl ester carboxylesterase